MKIGEMTISSPALGPLFANLRFTNIECSFDELREIIGILEKLSRASEIVAQTEMERLRSVKPTQVASEEKQVSAKMSAWCYECRERKEVKEVYFDNVKIAVTLECGHEYYAGEVKRV